MLLVVSRGFREQRRAKSTGLPSFNVFVFLARTVSIRRCQRAPSTITLAKNPSNNFVNETNLSMSLRTCGLIHLFTQTHIHTHIHTTRYHESTPHLAHIVSRFQTFFVRVRTNCLANQKIHHVRSCSPASPVGHPYHVENSYMLYGIHSENGEVLKT